MARSGESTPGPDVGVGELGVAVGTISPALSAVAERRKIRVFGLTFPGRRRRPSGEKPPLPRPLQAAGWLWLVGAIAVGAIWAFLFVSPSANRWIYRVDHSVVHGFADLRSGPLDAIAKGAAALASLWVIRPLRVVIVLVLAGFRRWHRLFTAVVIILVVEWVVASLNIQLLRERPLGVDALIGWSGPSHPSIPVASLTVTLVAILMALVPAGELRRRGAILATGVFLAAALARMYAGVDHPSDVLFAALIACAIAIVGFRLLAPDPSFPVSYRLGKPAHLEITPERSAAIQSAAAAQAGLDVTGIEPHGLEGSAGSTPLRLTVSGAHGSDTIFAKLHNRTHLRSDRWYKAARTILYGSLEDEVRFGSVSLLVEREDYMLRVMADAGVPAPAPLGVLEIVPEREYLLTSEFVVDGRELADVEVDDAVVLDCLRVIRRLWDSGLAHRDIKASNVMVQHRRATLVDVAFATARPTAWRQAVDLANMMLILGLRAEPERVYELAVTQFAPDDVAEAFAATHGVTIPSELRRAVTEHRDRTGVDLVNRFRSLAPQRDIIHLQRWSARRIGLALGALAGLAVVGYLAATAFERSGILL